MFNVMVVTMVVSVLCDLIVRYLLLKKDKPPLPRGWIAIDWIWPGPAFVTFFLLRPKAFRTLRPIERVLTLVSVVAGIAAVALFVQLLRAH